MTYEVDEQYMRRCLQLAESGRGFVSPNPMVGAVIVCDGVIIGEGYHRRCGEAHAEVNAVASVQDSRLLCRSTLYVSLEPCSHYGKTPPCCKLIMDRKIPRVVVGCLDPFPAVSGRGVAILREAGVEVITGMLEDECRLLNKMFVTAHTRQYPYVTLKWAQSADGYIDKIRDATCAPQQFSDEFTRRLSHRLRAEYDAIMVGAGTIMMDNPTLTLRYWPGGCNPLRVVLTSDMTAMIGSKIFSDGVPTVVFTSKTSNCDSHISVYELASDRPILPQVLSELYRRGVTSLLVEGGAVTLQHFIDAGLWDEARVEVAPFAVGSGVAAPRLPDGLSSEVYRYGDKSVFYYSCM